MRLRELREAAQITQLELGVRVGVEQNTVSQWESGARQPRADKLPQLARILGCTIDDLFQDEQNAASER